VRLCSAYAEGIQNTEQFGLVLSSNGRSTVSVTEVYDTTSIPPYPMTSDSGVAYFIHYEKLICNPGCTAQEAQVQIGKQMSQVCLAYAKLMFS
jgi:hypothetical protein